MRSIRHGGERSVIRNKYPNVVGSWLDLSTGVNPTPYPWVDKIPANEILEASANLPDQDLVDACRDTWCQYLGAQNELEWTVTAGSQAVINLFPYLFHDHSICLPEPTYGEHVRVWKNEGRLIKRFKAHEVKTCDFPARSVVIITNPNNPDGTQYKPEDLLVLAKKLESLESILVVDEAFCDVLSDHSLASHALPNNVLIMRSFGKFFGLAGLRIGCLRATPHLQEKLQTLLGPWSVNAVAILAAKHALEDTQWISQTRQKLERDSSALKNILRDNNLNIVGGTDLFQLVQSSQAANIADRLAHRGIYVRTFIENQNHIRFGLPANNEGFARLNSALQG